MSFLTIATIPVLVAEGTFKENARDQGGTRSRAYAGNLRITVRWEKRSWQATTLPMLRADANALKAAVALGAIVSCAGDAIGSTISGVVTLGDETEVPAQGTGDGLGFMLALAFTIQEV